MHMDHTHPAKRKEIILNMERNMEEFDTTCAWFQASTMQ